ncbi:MAG TPA: ATP-binding protein [Armatimonadota bacterium]|jgi:signal transduction histidine kinase/CheY-like chemotaxis protein
MHNSPLISAADMNIGDAWTTQWLALLCEASHQPDDDVSGYLRLFVEALIHDASPLAPTEALHMATLAEQAFDPRYTHLPVDETQRLGLLALHTVLQGQTALAPDDRARWLHRLLPWLQHPLFSLTALHAMAMLSDPGEVLAQLIAELHALTSPTSINVWRFINDDSPLIEVAQGDASSHSVLGKRHELTEAAQRGVPVVHENQVIFPLKAADKLFALIELSPPPEEAAALILATLLLVRTAEQALARLSRYGEFPNPATWQRVLNHLARMLTVTHSANDILLAVFEQVRQALPCERIGYWDYRPDSQTFVLRTLSARLTGAVFPVGSQCPGADTPLQVAWHTGKPVLLGTNWPQLFPNYPNVNRSINAIAVIPLVVELQTIGILTVERLEPRPFSRHDADWLMLVAAMVGTALCNIETHQALKLAQERMLEDTKMRALGEMAAGIAHDFNNILMGIGCHLELLKMAPTLQHVYDRLPRLERATLDAREIIQRVSVFGRKNEGTALLPFHLSDILHDVAELLQPQLDRKAVILAFDCPPNIWVAGNAVEFREVVTNLMTNAVHAMPNGGALTLSCGADTRTAWLSVQDTGVGMSPGIMARAFDPFFSTKGGKGTGLGLSVSYRIVQQHGGVIRLESEEGTGTTVRVEVPRCSSPLSVDTHEAVSPILRILLVDDDEEITEMLGQLLRQMGHQVQTVNSAAEAIRCCNAEVFDLVITDLVMYGETGDVVAIAVRRLRPQTRIMLLSGSLNLEDEYTALYDGILQKPVSRETLQAAIERVVRRKMPEPLQENHG